MLNVHVIDDEIRFGEAVTIGFRRTLRIPDDGREYPLPPGLGTFPVFRVEDYTDRVPEAWHEHGGVFIPMYQREAMWVSFSGRWWKPNAVKIGIGKINAVTGQAWDNGLSAEPQDYVVVPDQPWLDGINAGDGFIKQFVAMPLGMGYTVEGQLTGKEEFGGIQVMVFEPKPARFPDSPPERKYSEDTCYFCPPCSSCEMGLGAGGRMRQRIYPDDYGLDTWDLGNSGRVYVHIVNSMMFREITGLEPPKTPISARQYTRFGLPWFDLYDEDKRNLSASKKLKGVKSVKEMDEAKGFSAQQDDKPVDVTKQQVVKLGKAKAAPVQDGNW
jgi:hypothetical protein